ncbi:hypothetical protein BDW60DRAFT_205019 [Aspergillus nidulans var. acristatus]
MAAGHSHYGRSDDKKVDASFSIGPSEAQDSMLSQRIIKNGQQVLITWKPAEEARIVRKLDFLALPILPLMFTWMAIDRTNVSGILTSTFLDDTSMAHDQANSGVSLLWSEIVLLELRLTLNHPPEPPFSFTDPLGRTPSPVSGLQCVGGLSTWGTTDIKSLGFIDRYNRFGYATLFVSMWTLAGLIALYRLPVYSKSSGSFYVAYLATQAAPSWQPINVTSLSRNFETPQKRAVAYAVYSE